MAASSLIGVGEAAADQAESVTVSTHVELVTGELETNGSTNVVLVGFSYGGYET